MNGKQRPFGTVKNDDISIIYEEPAISEKIPIKYYRQPNDQIYNRHVIYDSFKPMNFRAMQDYINFLLNFRKLIPNTINEAKMKLDSKPNVGPEEILSHPDISQEIKDYYNSESKEQLSGFVILYKNW